MAQISPPNRNAALPPNWPKTEHSIVSKTPEAFFSKLPTELWLMIDENLESIDQRTLRLSSKFCNSVLETLPPLESVEDRARLACRTEQDWLQLPDRQLCIVCMEPHERLMAQPRQFPKEFRWEISNHALCKGGIRLTADMMMCQCCWTFLVMHKRAETWEWYEDVFQEYPDSWKHAWRAEWRRGKLLLKVTAAISLSEPGGMAEWLIKYGTAPQMTRLMGRVSFCGCKGTHSTLQEQMRRKVETFLSSRLSSCLTGSSWIKRWGISKESCFDCAWCGAFYTVSIVNDKLIVMRYYNLSSAEAMAASVHWDNWHPKWRAPQFWKDVGIRTRLEWQLSCLKTRVQSLYGANRAL
jgi:hypothetical protein